MIIINCLTNYLYRSINPFWLNDIVLQQCSRNLVEAGTIAV
jgi:hypothetical protein